MVKEQYETTIITARYGKSTVWHTQSSVWSNTICCKRSWQQHSMEQCTLLLAMVKEHYEKHDMSKHSMVTIHMAAWHYQSSDRNAHIVARYGQSTGWNKSHSCYTYSKLSMQKHKLLQDMIKTQYEETQMAARPDQSSVRNKTDCCSTGQTYAMKQLLYMIKAWYGAIQLAVRHGKSTEWNSIARHDQFTV